LLKIDGPTRSDAGGSVSKSNSRISRATANQLSHLIAMDGWGRIALLHGKALTITQTTVGSAATIFVLDKQ
jgi:hypothetical protein